MANDDAWQAGLDIGSGKNKKSKKKPNKNRADKDGPTSGAASGGGNPYSILKYLPLKHSGGKVKKTGAYRLKRGETVLTKTQMKSMRGKKSARKRVSGKA